MEKLNNKKQAKGSVTENAKAAKNIQKLPQKDPQSIKGTSQNKPTQSKSPAGKTKENPKKLNQSALESEKKATTKKPLALSDVKSNLIPYNL